jgi:hypothetical protein
MNKITVKDFVKGYENCVNAAKKRYIDEKLRVIDYLPVIRKDAIAITITNRTMYKQESYIKDNGEESTHKTDEFYINSFNQYILFCKIVIEEYTNLVFEDINPMNEYDLLKKSGLLDMLIVGTDKEAPYIPVSETSELRQIIEMHKSDVMTNYYSPQAYISRQVERFGTLANLTIEPLIKAFADKIDSMEDNELKGKVLEFVNKADFKEV